MISDERKGKRNVEEQAQRGAQILAVVKEVEAGRNTADVAREHGVSKHTIYAWRAKYGGIEVSEAQRLRELAQWRLAVLAPLVSAFVRPRAYSLDRLKKGTLA
jgi:hypothetical protein